MTKNWMLTEELGINGIAFPNKSILIPITIPIRENANITTNQWLFLNVLNAARENNNNVELATYEYGNMYPLVRIFKNKTSIKITRFILSMKEKEVAEMNITIPKKYCGELFIYERESTGNKYWILQKGKKQVVL